MAAKKSAVRRSTSDSEKRFAAWVRDMKRAGWRVTRHPYTTGGWWVCLPREVKDTIYGRDEAWRALRDSLPKRCRG